MAYKKSGELAVFFALLLGVMSLFVVMIIDNAGMYEKKAEANIAMDTAIRSIFAEYNKLLYDKYHLMYIDPTYKTDSESVDLLINHFELYLALCLNTDESVETGNNISVKNVQIDNCRLVTDDNICKQIEEYENKKGYGSNNYIISYVMECFGYSNKPSEECAREGEIEYILYGYENDYLNMYLTRKDYFMELEEYGDVNDEIFISSNDYRKYLLRKLSRMDESQIIYRMKKLIEENIRQNGSPGFALDNCYYNLKMVVEFNDSKGKSFKLYREYEYV